MARDDVLVLYRIEDYQSGRGWNWIPAVPDAGWGRRPEPPPPSRRDWTWLDYYCCAMIAFSVFAFALEFRGFLLDDEYSVVNVLVLILTRMHMLVNLVMKLSSSSPAPSSWTALALLPTCPAPPLITPPVCYEWEKPAAAMVVPGISGSAVSNWWSDEQDDDYMAAKKCFDSLLGDAVWTCDDQEDDYKAAMKCFDSLVHDTANICFFRSYDAIPLARPSDDDPPPT